jgi:ribonucleoside-diphosphate reductase alpha chain
MKTAPLHLIRAAETEIPYQPASYDIWDKKYRLKKKDGTPVDLTMDDTYQRIAHALAEVEDTPEKREFWYGEFLWALRLGAIPAGRIISNAGALDYKPATSTINCTVSGSIQDSMDDILRKVHEAGLTLKAGCVAPGTWIRTENGLVTVERAVAEQHRQILCYDREQRRFEMQPILRHLTVTVPQEENIEIISNRVSLKTSIKHPVLVYRAGRSIYIRADEVRMGDALVHHRFAWSAGETTVLEAWFAGAHLGDGSAYEKRFNYKPSRKLWAKRAQEYGKRLIFKIRAAERKVVERYAAFFQRFCGSLAKVVAATTTNGTSVCDYTVASFEASHVASLIDHQIGKNQHDRYVMAEELKLALARESPGLSHKERLRLGFYHGYHQADSVSRIWLDSWAARFPHLGSLIGFTLTLRPVEAIQRNLDLSETFYDFTVERHNNYLAGNNGLVVIHNCGIGYEFSTLRPKGAYVSGAGAYTSGPLSFMDIYDKMCFTVSSAGGRRGAQMATFDVGHPDVKDFIRAKLEDGRLRQFNLSLLITEDFMQAVKNDTLWKLAFPLSETEVRTEALDLHDPDRVIWRDWPIKDGYIVNETGQVACKGYKTLRARHLWDMIMASTYDYAEPGFVLIDRYNEMNNNWFCENIRATNPCVTADTRLHTQYGMIQIGELYAAGVPLNVTIDNRALGSDKGGVTVRSAVPPFMTAREADVYCVVTGDGYEINATAWHDFYTPRGKVKLRDLKPGDELLVQSGKGLFGNQGSQELGMLIGLITGDGHFTQTKKNRPIAYVNLWNDDQALAPAVAVYINSLIASVSTTPRKYKVRPIAIPERNHVFIGSVLLAHYLEHYGFTEHTKFKVPEVIWRGTEECVKGYMRALFNADGTVNISGKGQSCAIRLASGYVTLLRDVQILLANFGIFSRIRKRRDESERLLPDGKGGIKPYYCKSDYELIINGESRELFMQEIGFLSEVKNKRYCGWKQDKVLCKKQPFTTKVATIVYLGKEPVYDTTQPDHNTVIFNGLVTGQCGEQGLPPYGACNLGSVNLTKFVLDPFTERTRFDWDEFRKVVRVFTRMLDNVVEINGLPLPRQREEITRKRRHGMGYLGLGSTLTLLRMKYGSAESLKFTEDVTRELALAGWEVALELAKEKGPAPIMEEAFEITAEMLRKRPELARDGYKPGDKVTGKMLHARYSRYMQRIAEVAPALIDELAEVGARFTHHSSIAPTGTISLSLANNASNGIEPSFAHHYSRNVIREGKKTKEKIDVYSFELLAYRTLVDPEEQLPDYFVTAEHITPRQHVDVQTAAQKWIDSSISKTANVPTDFPFEDFKDIYLYAYEQELKGCTTFRFNPEAFQGVLVKERDLENTSYRFVLEGGEVLEVKGNEEIEYDGEVHTAANLYDALKEGYYGKF